MTTSLYWYDFETTGIDSKRDRVVQFAGIRTDLNFNIVAEPDVFYCKLHDDILPHPEACLVTGISPQLTLEKGLLEVDFVKKIHQQFSVPQTCVAGFNSIRFDDEFTRNLFYRNFYDPYAREWKSGNSRWDIIDVVRLTHALRPEGISWPKRDDGTPSFKLEQLTKENNIAHESAHDALSDVHATIAVAKLIKDKQPKLYDWAFSLRDKKKAVNCLSLLKREAVVHISGKYPASKHCLAVVMPIAQHPINKNGIIAYDLSVDPQPMLLMTAEQIYQRVYTSTDKLPEGEQRISLKIIHANKSPMLAPLTTLSEKVIADLNIDLLNCEVNRQAILNSAAEAKLAEVFLRNEFEPETDPDLMLYGGGFFSYADARHMETIRTTPCDGLAELDLAFDDERLYEMLFRYRARNYPDSLTKQEAKQWMEQRVRWLTDEVDQRRLDLKTYFERLDTLVMEDALSDEQQVLLAKLIEYGEEIAESLQS